MKFEDEFLLGLMLGILEKVRKRILGILKELRDCWRDMLNMLKGRMLSRRKSFAFVEGFIALQWRGSALLEGFTSWKGSCFAWELGCLE